MNTCNNKTNDKKGKRRKRLKIYRFQDKTRQQNKTNMLKLKKKEKPWTNYEKNHVHKAWVETKT